MGKAKSWKIGSPGEPSYPDDFEIVQKAVLQVTDIKSNHNKYYAIELHRAGGQWRVFTHYGRTDDLDSNPNAGMREGRYFLNEHEARMEYQSIFRQKTSPAKGYVEVNLASSRIGSQKARGTSSGEVDSETLMRSEGAGGASAPAKPKPTPSKLHPMVQDVVRYLYNEATEALTTTVQVRITAQGIETPLGVLTLGQVDKGQAILDEAYEVFKKGGSGMQNKLINLSGQYFTAIPHKIGRSRAAVDEAVIDTLPEFEQHQETLQLMRDMLKVDDKGQGTSVLFNDEVDQKYKALNCLIDPVEHSSGLFKEMKEYVEHSQIKSKSIKVQNVFKLHRKEEHDRFLGDVGNERLLFHGSRIKNWVGILSRGILMPKIVVSMGVNRTDAGWLGNGIYFGDAACTSLYYTTPGKKKTRMMAIARVALGKSKEFYKITYGITEAPSGFHSTHGVRNGSTSQSSQFADDEFVIYDDRQQRLEYLVEFTG